MTAADERGSGPAIDPAVLRAEMSILGAALQSTQALEIVGGVVGPEDYARPAHAHIHRAMLALAGRGDPVDVTSVAGELAHIAALPEGRNGPSRTLLDVVGPAYLRDLVEAFTTAGSTGYHARTVADASRRRRRVEALSRAAHLAANPTADLDAIEEELRARLEREFPTKQDDPQIVNGEQFLYSDDPEPLPIWGTPETPLWADGESLMLVGPPGTGKSTVAHMLVFARIGLIKEVLGYPVVDDGQRVLYIAADRPRQLRRAMRRLAHPDFRHREVLHNRLVVHKGPLPVDITKPENARYLLDMARAHGATTVVIDSIKDVLPNASDETAAGGYNIARQYCMAAGIEWIEIHHNRKAGAENKEPNKLDDVYGNRQLTSGCGSALSLFGEPGDVVVHLTHLRTPGEGLLPMYVRIDTAAGIVEPYERIDLSGLLMRAGAAGLTAEMAASALYDVGKPSKSQRETIRTRLNRMTARGEVETCLHPVDMVTAYRLPMSPTPVNRAEGGGE
ncbi:DnaB-like helicase N-terminal domain-containing protein [Frankia sp. Cj3]|uniref:DnaB-like helicase N-terminal domain-containing protein n=1 Tax=Frankia sp. Cj3 TaxID=2880976 RepID=UPI001EF69A63|nr:DnaB-like helicase N-terminal domain-containing protein [Frankia sp. Cj3]